MVAMSASKCSTDNAAMRAGECPPDMAALRMYTIQGKANCTLHTLHQTSKSMLDSAFIGYKVRQGLYTKTSCTFLRLAKEHLCFHAL